MHTVNILGVNITSTTKEEALEFIKRGLQTPGKKMAIFTPNPEIIMYANQDKRFRAILNSSDLSLVDGIGVMWAGKVLGKSLKERIAGADFMEKLCKMAEKEGFTVGLMGGGTKIAERAAECLLVKYPKLKIVFASSEWAPGWARTKRTTDYRSDYRLRTTDYGLQTTAVDRRRWTVDILFVALGLPKQEKWIAENLPRIPVRVAMAVGGSFDYVAGRVPRAPLVLRNLGLEWLFRLLVEPWRIRRQFALIEFVLLILKERFLKSSHLHFFF